MTKKLGIILKQNNGFVTKKVYESSIIDSNFQTKTDNGLNTTSKTIVGAINENNINLSYKLSSSTVDTPTTDHPSNYTLNQSSGESFILNAQKLGSRSYIQSNGESGSLAFMQQGLKNGAFGYLQSEAESGSHVYLQSKLKNGSNGFIFNNVDTLANIEFLTSDYTSVKNAILKFTNSLEIRPDGTFRKTGETTWSTETLGELLWRLKQS